MTNAYLIAKTYEGMYYAELHTWDEVRTLIASSTVYYDWRSGMADLRYYARKYRYEIVWQSQMPVPESACT